MNEDTLVMLLSRLARQLLEHFDERNSVRRPDEFARRLAEATWDGLIFTVRQSLAAREELVLRDFGLFRQEKGRVRFEPAASLVQAGALAAPAPEAHLAQAERALYYLHEAAELLKNIPHDLEARPAEAGAQTPSAQESAESRVERFFTQQRGSAANTLSARVQRAAEELSRTAHRLANTSASAAAETTSQRTLTPQDILAELETTGTAEAEGGGNVSDIDDIK